MFGCLQPDSPQECQPLVNGPNHLPLVQVADSRTEAFRALKNDVIAGTLDSTYKDSTLLNECDGNELRKPILVLSCKGQHEFSTVTPDTITALITNGAQKDYIDQEWYGWEPLHYAAAATNPAKLEAVCNALAPEARNTLTMLSENALHVLLANGVSAETFDVLSQNGQALRMMNIISREHPDVIECARILIGAGVDVNHSDFWNETPILVAIKRKYWGVVRLLLEEGREVDLDSCRDAVSGKTARELLRGRENLGVLPPPVGPKPHEKVLFELLKADDVDAFLKYSGGKIRDFVGAVDGDNDANSSCTLLQYCFRKSLILWYQDKRRVDCEVQFRHQEMTASRLVEVFCQSGMAKCMVHLLDNGAPMDKTLRKFENGSCLLKVAITKGYYPVVALLLARLKDNDLSLSIIGDALVELIETNNTYSDLNHTLSVVLSRLVDMIESNATVNLETIHLLKLLQNRARKISKDNQLLLLKFPGSLCLQCDDEHGDTIFCFCCRDPKSVLADIDPDVIRTHLDDCVQHDGKSVTINCRSFLKDKSLLSVFKIFLSDGLRQYLTHSVFKILIMKQWENLKPEWPPFQYRYLNLYFYVFFYILLNLYILFKFNDVPVYPLNFLVWFCFIVFTGKELLQIFSNWELYLKEVSNYLEIIFIVFTAIVLCSDAAWVDAIEVMTVLFSNVVLFCLLLNEPSCVEYIIILRTIAFYVRYILFYFVQFVAFAICFYILFSNTDQTWTDIFDKIFDTIILFTGNLDYMDTPWKKDSNNSTQPYHSFPFKQPFSKIIFIFFVLLIAIMLQNLLLGLLVIDMDVLQKEVAVHEQVKKASFVVRMESFFDNTCLQEILPKKLLYHKMAVGIYLTVNDNDKKILKEKERQYFDFILMKKAKRQSALKKLTRHIGLKINDVNFELFRNEENREIADKLEVIEDMVKNLQETKTDK